MTVSKVLPLSLRSLALRACAVTFLLSTLALSAFAEDPPVFVLKWGTGGFGNGQFGQPFGIGVSNTGFVYVADAAQDRIQKFTTDSIFVLKWGSTGTGPGQFDNPSDVTVDAVGNVYVLDLGNNRIQKFDANGNFITAWTPPIILDHIAAHPTEPLVYIASSGGVAKFDADGQFLAMWSYNPNGLAEFGGPAVGLSGNVYVADGGNHRVVKFAPDGTFLGQWGSHGEGETQFRTPTDVAVDADENVYVLDRLWVRKFSSNGAFITRWGGVFGSGDGEFRGPLGIALDTSDNVYVLDTQNFRVQKFSKVPTPTVPTSWGRIKALYR